MGRDKARVELAGKPLVAHAVAKLRKVCGEVFVLSNDEGLEEFAPVVRDLHPGCGPLGGMEAGLTHTGSSWNVFLPVDVPFVPAEWLRPGGEAARVKMFRAGGRMQPAVCLLHREVLPFVVEAVSRGEWKLLPVLEGTGRALAGRVGAPYAEVFEVVETGPGEWFANLNTPEDLARAETLRHLLDTSGGGGIG